MARARRVDRNQSEIVSELRKAGYTVAITSALGDGFPDIVVGAHQSNFLFEIKDPEQPPSKRKLTPDEEKFQDKWTGQYAVIHSTKEAIDFMYNHLTQE